MITIDSTAARRVLCCALLGLAFAVVPAAAQTPSKNLAPGFTQMSRSDKVVIMPVDVELFSLSAGGVAEPKADWTASALGHMKAALAGKTDKLGLNSSTMTETEADAFAEEVALHAAVARSIALHHGFGGGWALPTKEGKLDWSFGATLNTLQAKTGARYALFTWIRDSYASAERKATMVALALLGVGIAGGSQIGYASLVDLETGRVLWFNRLARASGDLREAKPAVETIETLLAGFPAVQ